MNSKFLNFLSSLMLVNSFSAEGAVRPNLPDTKSVDAAGNTVTEIRSDVSYTSMQNIVQNVFFSPEAAETIFEINELENIMLRTNRGALMSLVSNDCSVVRHGIGIHLMHGTIILSPINSSATGTLFPSMMRAAEHLLDKTNCYVELCFFPDHITEDIYRQSMRKVEENKRFILGIDYRATPAVTSLPFASANKARRLDFSRQRIAEAQHLWTTDQRYQFSCVAIFCMLTNLEHANKIIDKAAGQITATRLQHRHI